jgi:hypothetical protein
MHPFSLFSVSQASSGALLRCMYFLGSSIPLIWGGSAVGNVLVLYCSSC